MEETLRRPEGTREDFGHLFVEILASNVSAVIDSLPPQKVRGGIDLGFRENHVRDFINEGIKTGSLRLPGQGSTLMVETRLEADVNPGRVDYCFVADAPGERTVVATCEAKGPVRKAFFDLNRFGRNWSRVFVEDIEKQLNRVRTHGNAEHYIALMLPFSESWVRQSSFREVIHRAVKRVPGAAVHENTCREVTLQSGSPLTFVILKVTAES